jgi:DNA end-binding protein Ku
MWKGVIESGGVRVPVKLYSAVQDRAVRFHLLHEKDRTPVQQRMVNPLTGKEVPREQVRKGYEVEPHTFVVLDDKELEVLEPPPSRDIEVTRFVPADGIDAQWYDRPYYLGPDGDAGLYHALAAALDGEKRAGIARWVMRKKAYVGALRAEHGNLVLVTLRHADEVIPVGDLKAPAGRDLDQKELKLAEQLVSALEDDFDPSRYHDEYRKRGLELIETKKKGGTVRLRLVKKKPTTGSLAGALQASLAHAQKERRRAAG